VNKEQIIINTVKELGRKHIGQGELNLRISWLKKCGSCLTPIEEYELKEIRGEKITSYEKTKYKKAVQDFINTKDLIKNLEAKGNLL